MAKTARIYTLEELKEKAKKALENPKLVEIVKTAPLNKDGKVNLSWVYGEAEKYVHAETKDLQKTKELAVATRFLAMIKRDYQDEFKGIIIGPEPEPEPEKETQKELKTTTPLWDEVFLIPQSANIIITFTRPTGDTPATLFSIQFPSKPYDGCIDHGMRETVDFIFEILNSLVGTKNFMSAVKSKSYLSGSWDCIEDLVLQNLIQILEERLGLKVKVCGNCRYYYGTMQDTSQGCMKYKKQVGTNSVCEYWVPKKVS